MKKTTFILTLIGIILMTGCQKDPISDLIVTKPEITLITGANYLSEGAVFSINTPFMVGLTCKAETLESLFVTIYSSDNIAIVQDTTTWDNLNTARYEKSFSIDHAGDFTLTATLKDTQNQTSTLSVYFSITEETVEIKPSIDPITDGGFITDGNGVLIGQPFNVGFKASGQNLTRLEVNILQNGNVIASHFEDIENSDIYNYSHSFEVSTAGPMNVQGIIKDAAGHSVSTDFTITAFEENPSAAFLGHYEGEVFFNGNYIITANILQDPITDELPNDPIPMGIELEQGDNICEVIGTCHIEDQPFSLKGVVNGNTITFESFDDVISYEFNLGGNLFNPQITATYNLTATLEDGILYIEGTCNGQSSISYAYIITGNIALESTMNGSLNKMR